MSEPLTPEEIEVVRAHWYDYDPIVLRLLDMLDAARPSDEVTGLRSEVSRVIARGIMRNDKVGDITDAVFAALANTKVTP